MTSATGDVLAEPEEKKRATVRDKVAMMEHGRRGSVRQGPPQPCNRASARARRSSGGTCIKVEEMQSLQKQHDVKPAALPAPTAEGATEQDRMRRTLRQKRPLLVGGRARLV